MEYSLMMDNDSGYVSHNQESNLDSSSENVGKSCGNFDVYLSEDALLEKPSVQKKIVKNQSFDSIVNSSMDSVKTEFSGFDDSASDASFVIPEVKAIVWDSNAHKENTPTTPPKPSPLKKVLANLTNTYDHNPPQAALKNPSNDKENVPPCETPKKLYENRQNSDMSPDLFDEDSEIMPKPKSPVKKESPKDSSHLKDVKLLKNVQNLLGGVHPPPSVTIIQIGVSEMLSKIEENKSLFWTATSTQVSDSGRSLLVNDKSDCVQREWPDVMKCRFHGLHYNRTKVSEDFEHLCLKYAERYVGAETQSSCTVFDANPPSSQKRRFSKPRWGAKSPGRRLSHLARRRITFSSSNLQSNNSAVIFGSRARQILVDARKLSMTKKSPRKTPSKSPFKLKKNTPSSSAKKKLAMRFREMSGEFENIGPGGSQQGLSFKRALFGNERDSGIMEKKSTKRALFSSPVKHSPKKSPLKLNLLDKKRKRDDSDPGNPPKLPRSMSLETHSKPDITSLLTRSFSEKTEELSDQHKKKLQWAVYESLRLQNVTPTHPQYKVFASVLARVTRKFLPSMRVEGRTTEKMFRIARFHSHAVVKGKTVDEIVNEYMRNRLKNQKPQGYIGIEEFEKLRNRDDKENILKDKLNTMEKRSEEGSKRLSQNRIDRIKKVITFEDKV